MVILADELLEQFFETFFPQSFQLSPPSTDSSTVTSPNATLSGNLTTFANLGTPVKNLMANVGARSGAGVVVDVGQAGGIVEPGSRGIRGVLDNIATQGMRMADEMRKKMEEAQREFERNATAQQRQNAREEEEDEEEEDEEIDINRTKRDMEFLEVPVMKESNSAVGKPSSVKVQEVRGDIGLLDLGRSKVEFAS